jgi:hypothetical protein
MDSFSDQRRLPCKVYGYVNIEHNRGMLDLALYLAILGSLSCNTWLFISQHHVVRPLSFRRLKEPNATADRYIDGRGMSFGLEDQKPQPKPPSSRWGFSFWLAQVCCRRN